MLTTQFSLQLVSQKQNKSLDAKGGKSWKEWKPIHFYKFRKNPEIEIHTKSKRGRIEKGKF